MAGMAVEFASRPCCWVLLCLVVLGNFSFGVQDIFHADFEAIFCSVITASRGAGAQMKESSRFDKGEPIKVDEHDDVTIRVGQGCQRIKDNFRSDILGNGCCVAV